MSSTANDFRIRHAVLGVVLASAAGQASALDFEVFDTSINLDSLFTVGGAWRMQDRSSSLVGKSTLFAMNNPGTTGLCLTREMPTGDGGPLPFSGNESGGTINQYGPGDVAAACSTSNAAANADFVSRGGSFSPNGDDGNILFDKYDLINAAAKLTSDLNFTVYDFNVFARGTVFFDQVYNDHEIKHPDTTMQAALSQYTDGQKGVNAFAYDILDFNISRSFDIFDRVVGIKIGKQVLNWGESSLLFLNSLNTINPPDARRARIPGFDLKEAFQPVGMVSMSSDIIYNVGVEVFYQYDWKGVQFDPVGTFYSPADILGVGGNYAMLSFAKAPEDPGFELQPGDDHYDRYAALGHRRGFYRPIDTCGHAPSQAYPTGCVDTIGALGSTASRTVFVTKTEPDDGGQYGLALRTFLEDFNNGTELNFYYANYHSRLPILSAISAPRTCLDSTLGALSLVTECGFTLPGEAAAEEPIPVDRMRLIVEYPEDIQLFGVSFNTTIGDYALSGEYAYRPNLPTQIHSVDLTYTALQPAFPEADITVAPGVVIPGRQSAFPSFLTRYRGFECSSDANCIQPETYIAGYEELKTGQLNLTVLRLIGGDNPIGASQMTILLETGLTHVLDFPDLDELQFQGGGTNTHISDGADGSQGIDPPPVAGNARASTTRQNPTAHRDHDGFGSQYSGGYRIINLNRWDSALFGANLETLAIVRHDVWGTAPGLGTNFTQGRKQFNLGLRFDYLSAWIGEIRYSWFTGGKGRDGERDKDNIFVTAGYLF